MRRGPWLLGILVIVLVAGTIFSYWTSGIVYLLFSGTPGQGLWIARVRDAVASWGRAAPIVYVMVVIVEVIVAPIPGALLYAPGGAIFGGFLGGTLSLIGNVVGAAICCALGRLLGVRVLGPSGSSPQLDHLRTRLADRGLWLVLLLRANPFTSSDLVSYAAGVAGISPWKVAIGTLGMAPLCYVQAHFAEQVFTLVPGPVLALGSVALLGIVLAVFLRGRS